MSHSTCQYPATVTSRKHMYFMGGSGIHEVMDNGSEYLQFAGFPWRKHPSVYCVHSES